MADQKNKDNELKIIRTYDASLEAVWDAWTDPKQVAEWWGPRGFTITTHSKELRVGGMWHYTMHGPDGQNYINKTIYHEVEKHKKLVYDHGGNDERAPLFRVTVLFSRVNSGTKMEMTMTLPTAEEARQTKEFIKKAGGNGTWDRLAEFLAKKSSDKEIFVINRSFEASIDVIYDMWTNPKHFPNWLPPIGFNMEFIKADIGPGGSAFYCMTGQSLKMFGRIHYVEMEKPNKISYTQQFCDADGNISRHPMAPTWPETMLTTVTFSAEPSNTTRVTVVWEVYGKASREELETFMKERSGMTQGWTGSFDKLDTYLTQQV